MQPQAPEEARVARAVPIVGGVGECERSTVSRLPAALHGRGVHEQQIVFDSGLWLANTPMSHSSVSASRATALEVAAWLGDPREQVARVGVDATARNRRSDGIPMIACATQSVTTSASVTIRLAFSRRSGRRSSAVT